MISQDYVIFREEGGSSVSSESRGLSPEEKVFSDRKMTYSWLVQEMADVW